MSDHQTALHATQWITISFAIMILLAGTIWKFSVIVCLNALLHFGVMAPLMMNRLSEGVAAGLLIFFVNIWFAFAVSIYLLIRATLDNKKTRWFCVITSFNILALFFFGLHVFLYMAMP